MPFQYQCLDCDFSWKETQLRVVGKLQQTVNIVQAVASLQESLSILEKYEDINLKRSINDLRDSIKTLTDL